MKLQNHNTHKYVLGSDFAVYTASLTLRLSALSLSLEGKNQMIDPVEGPTGSIDVTSTRFVRKKQKACRLRPLSVFTGVLLA